MIGSLKLCVYGVCFSGFEGESVQDFLMRMQFERQGSFSQRPIRCTWPTIIGKLQGRQSRDLAGFYSLRTIRLRVRFRREIGINMPRVTTKEGRKVKGRARRDSSELYRIRQVHMRPVPSLMKSHSADDFV